MLSAGQPLNVLIKVAFGEYSMDNKEKTQKILYKLRKEYKISYCRETRVWFLLEEY
jgi:hypothetical protein